MSTVQPETEIALAKKVGAKGATLVECPVGGTVGPALTGKLLGVAGGTQEDFARAKPLLEQMCRRVDLVGPIGAGASMKLAINLPLATFWQSFGEAFALCRHLNLDPAWLVELFAETSGGPNVLRARGGAVALALQAKDSGSATFDCEFDPQGLADHGRGSKVARLRAAAGRAHARGLRSGQRRKGGAARIAPNCRPSGPATTKPELVSEWIVLVPKQSDMSVGMIGLGIMGSAMSKNLIKAGFSVIGFDVLPKAMEAFEAGGGKPAKSVGEVGSGADILITSLPSAKALFDVVGELQALPRAATYRRGNQHLYP